MNKTKIIATIGPATEKLSAIEDLIKNGMNVARLNFSHGDHVNHALLIRNIRSAAKKLDANVAIIQDLHGPKIRVLDVPQPIDVAIGDTVVIGRDFKLNPIVVKAIRPRQRILIEDGLIELEVTKVVSRKLYCTVLSPGRIQQNKGVNLPRTRLMIPILGKKDVDDLAFGIKMDVDYVALSFIRTHQDVVKLRKLIQKFTPRGHAQPRIIAKIEKPVAVKNFDKILNVSDVIMVARGDLGVEMPSEEVPIIQKTIIQRCLQVAKPVIVATQMLESMVRNPRPTRAEVSDVANAVIDQADCVMLSGESAYGKYPVKAVAEMSRIIRTTEKSVFIPKYRGLTGRISKVEAITESVYAMAKNVRAKLIVGATESGYTARVVARTRPHHSQLVMFTTNPKVMRQLALVWGVESFLIPKSRTFEDLMQHVMRSVRQHKLARRGDKAVVVTGEPLGLRENLNLVEVKTV